MQEAEYRKKIQDTFTRITSALDSVDPDVVEFDTSNGQLTLIFSDRSRCILSAQPSVRQLWMAVAARGVAYHFNWDEAHSEWRDDKGQGIEVLSYLSQYLSELARLNVRF